MSLYLKVMIDEKFLSKDLVGWVAATLAKKIYFGESASTVTGSQF